MMNEKTNREALEPIRGVRFQVMSSIPKKAKKYRTTGGSVLGRGLLARINILP